MVLIVVNPLITILNPIAVIIIDAPVDIISISLSLVMTGHLIKESIAASSAAKPVMSAAIAFTS